ncbi:hypothetical protein SUGI_0849350, partial [Cryptomeria japonica]
MSVLLLERGGSPFGNEKILNIENFEANLDDTGSNRSTGQQFVSEDGVLNIRPRVLGGGTCLNAGFYTRESSSEVKAMGLEPGLVEQSCHWVESVVAHRPPPNEWQNAVEKGLIETDVSPYNGFTYDHIPGTKLDETRPKAKGVVFIDVDGREQQAFSKDGKSEVIIFAGALGSPQLLMLSGIGHAEELKPMGIKVIMDQLAVGKDVDGREQQAFLKDGSSEVIISAGALGSPQLLMLSGIGLVEELKPMGIKVIMDQHAVGKVLCLFPNETRPKAKGVVFIDVDGREQQAFLKDGKSEVIISVGALRSPQLLMLSGIGHAEELKPMGIKVIMDQPTIGK